MSARNTILLVDDNEDDRSLMRTALKRARCKFPVHELSDGDETLAYLKGDSVYYDRGSFPLPAVILLDLNMPKKNGFEILSWLGTQAELRRITIVILTASLRREDVERAFDLGASSYLVKPSSLDDLTIMMKCFCEWIQINHFPSIG